MTHGFIQHSIKFVSADGRNDVLMEPLQFKSAGGILYRVPSGSTTDGMSTPAIVHAIPGFEPTGKHWFSAILHDAAYRGTLQRFRFAGYQRANLTRAQADELFADALATQGVGPVRRGLIYHALRLFGWTAYRRAA